MLLDRTIKLVRVIGFSPRAARGWNRPSMRRDNQKSTRTYGAYFNSVLIVLDQLVASCPTIHHRLGRKRVWNSSKGGR